MSASGMAAGTTGRHETRVYLLLQGLMGPFFSRLGAALADGGHDVHSVMFNGGDRFFWRNPNAVNYSGSLSEWPLFLEDLLGRLKVTDVVLFGDGRPVHRAAVAVCRRLQVQTHVFEEGYIRPDYVTLERDGVNGNSSLPRDPQWYRETAASLPPAQVLPPIPCSFATRVRQGILYNLAQLIMSWRYPRYVSHRPWHPLHEGLGWLRRLSERPAARKRSAARLAELERSGSPFFLFPLQLDNDSQLQLHSPFRGLPPAIEHVIASFAASAPQDTRLVVKQHPLDNGLQDWQGLVAKYARDHGAADRIDYIEIGDILSLVVRARGVVTINSTTGTLALASGIPTAVLGYAVYDMAGITSQSPLDSFWAVPEPPDPELFAAFRRVLIERCLIPGGFFSDYGLDLAVNSAVARLTASGATHAVLASQARPQDRLGSLAQGFAR